MADLEVWTSSLLVGQWMGQRGQRESTPNTLPKPGPGPGCLWRPHPRLLTQSLHLLRRVTNSSAHHHSCGLPAPACPQAPLSLIPPGLLPFPLSGTTVHNLISPSSPLPQHSHLPFLIQCQQLVSEQSQIKQMCVGLAGTWQRAPCPAPSPIRALSQLVGVWVPSFQDPPPPPQQGLSQEVFRCLRLLTLLVSLLLQASFPFSYSSIPSPSLLLVFYSIFYLKNLCLTNQTHETFNDYVKKKKKEGNHTFF